MKPGETMHLSRPLLYPFARRFFAGLKLNDAIRRAKNLNSRGVGATIDFLGEDVREGVDAREAKAEYSRAIEAISDAGLDASLSIKLTHIGLNIIPELAEKNLIALAGLARAKKVFLWIDMEGSEHTSDTIEIYRRLLLENDATGIALQAYLKRTWTDLESLLEEGAVVRLVKGAYNEPPDVAFQGMRVIRLNFIAMAEHLFKNARAFAIATHDRGLIQKSLELAREHDGKVEFQMLMGMRDDLKRSLASQGMRVVEYVPYGSDWYGYGMRRLKEKRRNILYFVQGLYGR